MKKLALGTALLLAPVLLLTFTTPRSFSTSASADDGALFDPSRVRWTRLELKARKLFFSVKSDVRLRVVAASEAASEWIESPRGRAVGPAGPEVLEVTIDTSGFRASTSRAWFNPGHAAVLQLDKLKPERYRKVARFSDEGIFVLRTAAVGKAEAKGPLSKWSKVQKYFYPRPDGGGCQGISVPSVLFYMLSARASDTPVRVCVFSNKQVVPVTIEVVGSESLSVDYEEIRGAATKHRQGRIEAQRIEVRPEGAGELRLMGLEGAVEILLDKETRVPLEVRGKIRNLGGVRIKLIAVELGTL